MTDSSALLVAGFWLVAILIMGFLVWNFRRIFDVFLTIIRPKDRKRR